MDPSRVHLSLYRVLYFMCAVSLSYTEKLQCFMGQVTSDGHSTVGEVDCTTASNVRPITSCLFFRYQTQADGSQKDSRLTYGGIGTVKFACDSSHYCNRYKKASKKWLSNVTLDGRIGDLQCCSDSKCNDPHVLLIPQNHVSCFVGSKLENKTQGMYSGVLDLEIGISFDLGSAPTSFLLYCRNPVALEVPTAEQESGSIQPCETNVCLNTTTINSMHYSCDSAALCTKFSIHSGQCKQITLNGVKRRFCCCNSGQCNIARGSLALQKQVKEDKSKPKITIKPMVPMPSDILPSVHSRQKSRLAGIVSAGVLGTALAILIVIVAVKQWQRYREKYNFSYMQLTADMMVL